MYVVRLSTLEELAPHAEAWDRLAAGVPLRSWAWNAAYWRHYGQARGRHLLVLGIFDQDRLVGVAPWQLCHCGPRGRVLRWLDHPEICGDYLGLLCAPSREEQVAETLADYLTDSRAVTALPRWDLLELTGVDAADQPMKHLAECLAARRCHIHCRPGSSCWRLMLPSTWDEYVGTLSKYHRRHVRKLDRELLTTGKAVLHTVESAAELPRVFETLVDLHERRRAMLGQRGRFALPRFAAFHRDVTARLLAAGQLQLHWLEMDGIPLAAEYMLSGGGVLYAYQSGVEPASLAEEPGRLITLAIIRRAIAQGYRAIDWLRGDEPYKAHFRARPQPQCQWRIVPPRAAACCRHALWAAGSGVKHWIAQR
jgi:CelD/BcsL family acetyltransferase involved in cellulose biosynthesis